MGMVLYASMVMIRQAALGKDAYLASVAEDWPNWKFTVPLAALTLVVVAATSFVRVRRELRG